MKLYLHSFIELGFPLVGIEGVRLPLCVKVRSRRQSSFLGANCRYKIDLLPRFRASSWLLSGWPDWANFRPFMWFFTLGSFFGNSEVAKKCRLLSSSVIVASSRFTKNWLCYILGDLLTNSSGHPGVDVMITIFCNFRQFLAKKVAFLSKNDVMIKIFHNLALF
jgi:hypothetical protein